GCQHRHLDTCAYFLLYSDYNYSFIDVDLCHSLSSFRKEDLMKRPLHLFLFSIVVCLLLAACVGSTTSSGTPTESPSVTLHVFAAASFTASFNEMARTYHQLHPNITIQPVYTG